MKKHFDKEFVMTKESNEDFENSTKHWFCGNDYDDNDVKVRDCNTNIKINHKIPVEFHNLNNYDSHLTIKKLGKVDLKINVMPNGSE